METIAIYWESKIRTYGFNLLEKLAFGHISMPLDHTARWGKAMQEFAQQPLFRLVWAQAGRPDRIKFFVLCDDIDWHNVDSIFTERSNGEKNGWHRHATPVDLIVFQGPHFGDRYGIMDFAFKTLAENRIPRLAAACSVASVHLVLPGGWGPKAKEALASAFKIPMQKT